MRFFYRLTEGATGWQATTQPPGDVGRGNSPAAAVLDLREVLTRRFRGPGGVLMRSGIGNVSIDLAPVDEELPGHLLDDEDDARPTMPESVPAPDGPRAGAAAVMPGGGDGS